MSAGEAAAFIRQHRRFLLLCHVSPDGDALGSSLALGLALEAAGREWTAACDTVCYPHKYAFLPGADRVHVGTPVTPEPDTALIFVDCASADRAGLYASLLEGERPTLCIDHHITNPGCKGQGYAGVNYVEDCAAAGELVYLLIRELGVPLTADMAACLYTALSTDTGNFAYDSVTKRTFCIMGALLEAGLDLPKYNQLLFRQERLAKTRLRARAVEHMTLYEENTVAVASLTLGEIEYRDSGGRLLYPGEHPGTEGEPAEQGAPERGGAGGPVRRRGPCAGGRLHPAAYDHGGSLQPHGGGAV